MIKEFGNNSSFAGVVSMKWISNHAASSTKLQAMNKELKDKESAKQEIQQDNQGTVNVKLAGA